MLTEYILQIEIRSKESDLLLLLFTYILQTLMHSWKEKQF